jgi:hypothetical protein
MYSPTSISGSFPQKANVPDSNYTMPSSVNARYAGTKLNSLTYNFFTPSGSVGPQVMLPIMPVNRSKNPIGVMVAPEFLDGSPTSSFDQTLTGQGNSSWGGDSRQYSGSATIDKHPIYMARFENSYEQLNLYNSYQYNIDQLIEVPFESIAGEEVTPNSITIDGSNENKKIVSAAFEPKRKTGVSYLNPKTRTVDYTQMQVGNFNILSGATEFLTLNSNAKSRVSASLAYQYTLGGIPPTGSRSQYQNTVQMVTGSNTFPNPTTAGVIDSVILTPSTTAPTANIRNTGLTYTLENVPLISLGGSGTGALVTVIFDSLGVIQSTTVTTGGQGYSDGSTLQITAAMLVTALENANPPAVQPTPGVNINVTGPLNFLLTTADITTSGVNQTSYGFLLSGSLTTDVIYGGNFNSDITNNARIGDINHPLNTQIDFLDYYDTNIYPSLYFNATPVGAYTGLETSTNGGGTGMTVDVTIAAGQVLITRLSVAGGSGYPNGRQEFATTDVSLPGNNELTVEANVIGGIVQPVKCLIGTVVDEVMPVVNTGADYTIGGYATLNGGNNLTRAQIVTVTTAIKSVKIVNPGQGYIPGDKIIIKRATLVAAGIIPNSTGLDAGRDYISRELTLSDLNPLTLPYSVNFNPSPISSSTNASIFSPPTVPESQQLLIGGPQLAVHHIYNTTISSSFYEINPSQLNYTPDRGPQSLLWTTSGSEASNVENYMIWNPDGSDSTSYQNTTTPFLIERGDIIRVEGVTNTINDANVSQSTAIVEDFTVEEIQNYAYSSSFNATYTNARNAFPSLVAGGYSIGGTPADIALNPPQVVNIGYAKNASGIANFFGGAGQPVQIGSTVGVYSSTGNTSGGEIQININNVTSPDWGWTVIKLTGGYGWQIGETITVSVEALTTTTNWNDPTAANVPAAPSLTVFTAPIIIQITPDMLIGTSFNNDFTFGVDVNAPNTTNEPGSVVGYNQYGIGDVGFVAPTFVRVEPDPRVVLNGLDAGAVTKMTIRRQIEADDRIMLKNITPPSGSRGVATPSGQGFLIPNDCSEVQKANALNIINQLKAKNAFNKPIEPGITKD